MTEKPLNLAIYDSILLRLQSHVVKMLGLYSFDELSCQMQMIPIYFMLCRDKSLLLCGCMVAVNKHGGLCPLAEAQSKRNKL